MEIRKEKMKRTDCKGIIIISILFTLLAACSLEGDIEALRQKPVGKPGLPAPSAPATAPTVTAANGMLTVSWQAVERATTYEVWMGTTNNPNTAVKLWVLMSGLSAVILDLTNNTTYYVWIKAKNSGGASGFSPVASGTPSISVAAPQAPATPTVSVGNGQITVTWAAVQGATAYEVWYGTTNNSASAIKSGADVSASLSATISSLSNGTTYYIWLKAKNNTGTSGFSPMVSGTPTRAGLYRGSINDSNKIGSYNLSQSLTYISSNAVSGNNFYIVLGANESTSIINYLDYSNKIVGITLMGDGGERTITYDSSGGYTFIINSGVTLTLDENITLNNGANHGEGVRVSGGTLTMNGGTISGFYMGVVVSGGTFTMNNGTISGNTSGVSVGADGTFTMNDGTISGNTNVGVASSGTFTMNDGTISGNTNVGVASSGTFIMNGGTISENENEAGGGIRVSRGSLTMYNGVISGNTAARFGGGVFVDGHGSFTMHGGTIRGNTSSTSGGGIYVDTNGTLFINGGTISGNISDSGGGIGTYGGTITMNSGTISGNTSRGGGIFVSGGTLFMYGGTISGNISNSQGGGVEVTSSGTFTMYGGVISGNTASSYGGGIIVSSLATFKKLPIGGYIGIIYGNEETGVDAGGAPLKNTASWSYGHAFYSSSARRNTTAGQTDQIDTTTGRGLSASGEPPYGN